MLNSVYYFLNHQNVDTYLRTLILAYFIAEIIFFYNTFNEKQKQKKETLIRKNSSRNVQYKIMATAIN